MSLQVWLPLNGSLDNQGAANIPNMSISSCEWIDGKIGKCIKIPRTNTNTVTISELNGCKKFSFCCWLYLDTSYTNSSYTRIFSLGNVSDDNTGYIRIETIPTNGQFQIIYNKSSTHGSGTYATVTYYGITGGDTDAGSNKWVHITVTNDGTNVRTYFNGVLKGTWKTNTIYDEGYLNGQLYLGGSYVNLNDVRIYDHCLSAKEVKEISKGLVCHYKLNGCGGENLVHDSLINETSYEYGFASRTVHIESGKQYTLSVKGYISEDAKNDGTTLKIYAYKSDWRYCPLILSISDTKETIVAGTFTSNQTIDLVISSYSYLEQSKSGNAVTVLWYKFEEGSKSTPWCPNPSDSLYSTLGYNDGIEYDCSGYGNNGTKVGNIAWSGDSPRYSGSYDFNGTNHIKTNYSASMPELSCSFWVKPNSQNGGYAIIASNYNNPSSGFWIAINCEGSGLWFYNGAYVKGNSLLSNDVWYHGVFTYNNGIGKWYLNGELVTTANIGSRGTSLTISNLSIGNSFTGTTWDTEFYGNISDFRLYSKCLSAEDVKALYNVSASIDKTGVLSAYEFVEEG